MLMEKQEQDLWCWAAVAVSLHRFLDQGTLTQGHVATNVLQATGDIGAGVDCDTDPQLCNYRARLDDALRFTNNLRPDGFRPGRFLTFNSVRSFVDADLPVGVRIVWSGGGGHFVVLDGYREFQSGARQVNVQDPKYGPSLQFYEDFVSDYPPGSGNWQDTYLVERNGS